MVLHLAAQVSTQELIHHLDLGANYFILCYKYSFFRFSYLLETKKGKYQFFLGTIECRVLPWLNKILFLALISVGIMILRKCILNACSSWNPPSPKSQGPFNGDFPFKVGDFAFNGD